MLPRLDYHLTIIATEYQFTPFNFDAEMARDYTYVFFLVRVEMERRLIQSQEGEMRGREVKGYQESECNRALWIGCDAGGCNCAGEATAMSFEMDKATGRPR